MRIQSFVFCLVVLWSAFQHAALALSVNPIDPSLPLTTHATTNCINAPDDRGADLSSCIGASSVENPATLTSVVGGGSAAASLRTGQLKAAANGSAILNDSDALRTGGYAGAKLYDTLTIHGSWSGLLPVQVRMSVDGSFFTTDPTNPNTQDTEVRGVLSRVADSGARTDVSLARIVQGNSGEVFLFDSSGTVTTNRNPVTNLFDPSDTRFTLAFTAFVAPSTPSFSFLAELDVSAALGFTDPSPQVKQVMLDFGNTAQLAVVLPAGLTYTSESGVFLSAVPEPSNACLLAIALSALTIARKTWTRKRAAAAADCLPHHAA